MRKYTRMARRMCLGNTNLLAMNKMPNVVTPMCKTFPNIFFYPRVYHKLEFLCKGEVNPHGDIKVGENFI